VFEEEQESRRQCLVQVIGGLGAAWLSQAGVLAAWQHAHRAASTQPAAFSFFDAGTAAEIEALAAQIFPADETPGAREAGVIHFIDRVLATVDRDKQALYKSGLAEAQAHRRKLFPDSRSIAALSDPQQIELLKAIEKSEFFELLRIHTLVGMFAHPSWGGNRNQAGWKVIGFEDSHVFQPPFGYYDDPKRFPEEP
jgi:hypothetical protein